jgi:hypothetical protein
MLTQISKCHLDEKERTVMADTTQRPRYFFELGADIPSGAGVQYGCVGGANFGKLLAVRGGRQEKCKMNSAVCRSTFISVEAQCFLPQRQFFAAGESISAQCLGTEHDP